MDERLEILKVRCKGWKIRNSHIMGEVVKIGNTHG